MKETRISKIVSVRYNPAYMVELQVTAAEGKDFLCETWAVKEDSGMKYRLTSDHSTVPAKEKDTILKKAFRKMDEEYGIVEDFFRMGA